MTQRIKSQTIRTAPIDLFNELLIRNTQQSYEHVCNQGNCAKGGR